MLASDAEGANPVSITGFVAKVATATRSSGCLARRKACAAATASRNGFPFIDLERSTASTTLFARPRFSVRRPLTARPFSVTFGALDTGFELTSVSRTLG